MPSQYQLPLNPAGQICEIEYRQLWLHLRKLYRVIVMLSPITYQLNSYMSRKHQRVGKVTSQCVKVHVFYELWVMCTTWIDLLK